MRILMDKTPVIRADMYFTHALYAVTQMSVHNLKIINGGKGEPGINTTRGIQPQN
jgi:hypothetical protein